MALLEESLSQPTEDTGMQSVLRTLLKKQNKKQNTHTHSFQISSRAQECFEYNTSADSISKKKKKTFNVFEMNLQHLKCFN